MRALTVAFGGSHPARVESTASLSWDEYVKALTAAPPETADKAAAGWSCPAGFRGGWRDADNLTHREALTFDFDSITRPDVRRIERALAPYEYLIYTTASHTPEQPRLRVVMPLARAVTPDEFSAVSRRVCADIDIELAARESHVPAQMMYRPTVKPGTVFKARRHRAPWLDPDTVLKRYDDWTDRASWPRRRSGDSVRAAEVRIDPRTKHGIIGEFCRAYTVTEAIARFELPYRHEHGNRWTYTRGTRAEGVIVYDDDTKLHSHNDTDPARGQHNAFDLVRLHRFADKDGEDTGDDPTALPSYRAMVEFLGSHDEFTERRISDAVGIFPALPALTAEQAAEAAEIRAQNPAAVQMDRLADEKERVVEQRNNTVARHLADVLDHPTVTRWLIRDVLEHSVIGVIAGPRGTFKSFVALDWAMRIATAGEPVYCVSAEGGDFDRRARAWLKAFGNGLRARDVPLYVVERRLDLNSTEGIKAVRADCERLAVRPRLFVLDTFSKLSGGLDENDNTEVKQFIGRLDNGLKRHFGASILLVAHTGHSDKGRPRGASAFGADTDAEYIVSRSDKAGYVNISRERFKSSPELAPLTLRAEVVPLDYRDPDGTPVTSLVLRESTSRADRVLEVGWKPRGAIQTIVWGVTKEALALGPMPVASLIEIVSESLIKPAEGRDDRPRSVRRALETFVADGVLFLSEAGDMVALDRIKEVADDAG